MIKLYGAKCHLCSHAPHEGEFSREPVPWLRKPADQLMWCEDCEFCQSNSLHEMLVVAGLGIFDPEVRRSVHAFQRGEPDPGIDRLRIVLQAMEVTVDIGGTPWSVVDSDMHVDEATGLRHLHLTLTERREPAESVAPTNAEHIASSPPGAADG